LFKRKSAVEAFIEKRPLKNWHGTVEEAALPGDWAFEKPGLAPAHR
jgi:hypothetical protein